MRIALIYQPSPQKSTSSRQIKIELDTPTIAPVLPIKFKSPNKFYSMTNVQFENCGIGLQETFCHFYARNILMHRVGTGFSGIF